MPLGLNDGAIGFAREDQFRAASRLLAEAGYSEEGILEYIGGRRPVTPIAVEIPPLVLPAKGGSDLEILMRLFLLGLPTETDSTRRVLQPMALEDWVGAGVLKLFWRPRIATTSAPSTKIRERSS